MAVDRILGGRVNSDFSRTTFSANTGMDAALLEMERLMAPEGTSSTYCCASMPPHELPNM